MTSQTQSKGKSIFVSLLILITLFLSVIFPQPVQAVPAVSSWAETGSLGYRQGRTYRHAAAGWQSAGDGWYEYGYHPDQCRTV